MSGTAVMHGGCFDCGSTAEAVLESRLCQVETVDRGQKCLKPTSIAICSGCRKTRKCEA